ncbi:MAG: GTP-binding protein [Janthinobacterium lividum]
MEARQQISFSDVLLITKTDLVTTDYLPYLENLLSEINPFAQVLSGNKLQYPFEEIFATQRKKM